jgi:hypothetical protein
LDRGKARVKRAMANVTNSTVVTAWNNGKHKASGAGYGLKVEAVDRDRLFRRNWRHAVLELDGVPEPIAVNVAKRSFWTPICRELIKKEIGHWLRQNGWAPWSKGQPPRFLLVNVGGNRFRVSHIEE